MKSIGMLALEKKLEQPKFVKALGSRSYQITRYTRPVAVLLPVPDQIDPKLRRINYRNFGSTIGWWMKKIRDSNGYNLVDRDEVIAIVLPWTNQTIQAAALPSERSTMVGSADW